MSFHHYPDDATREDNSPSGRSDWAARAEHKAAARKHARQEAEFKRYRDAADRVNRMTDNGDVLLQQTEDGHHKFVDAPQSAEAERERAGILLNEVAEGKRPSIEEVTFLHTCFSMNCINNAVLLGMWADIKRAK